MSEYKYIVIRERQSSSRESVYRKNVTDIDRPEFDEVLEYINNRYPHKYYEGLIIRSDKAKPEINQEPKFKLP